MLERGKMERGIFEIVDTESLVPAEHLLRKIDAAVGFNKIYDSEKVFSDGRILSTAYKRPQTMKGGSTYMTSISTASSVQNIRC